jgi:hypothetical protein
VRPRSRRHEERLMRKHAFRHPRRFTRFKRRVLFLLCSSTRAGGGIGLPISLCCRTLLSPWTAAISISGCQQSTPSSNGSNMRGHTSCFAGRPTRSPYGSSANACLKASCRSLNDTDAISDRERLRSRHRKRSAARPRIAGPCDAASGGRSCPAEHSTIRAQLRKAGSHPSEQGAGTLMREAAARAQRLRASRALALASTRRDHRRRRHECSRWRRRRVVTVVIVVDVDVDVEIV